MPIQDNSKPADSSKQAHWQYEKFPPQVHPDGRVTFRVAAPLAHKLQIEPLNGKPENNGYNGLGAAAYDMTKDENGIWSVTTPPAVPGLHNYWLVVDGARVNDTTTKSYGGKMKCCGVEVPDPGVDFYDIKGVPLRYFHAVRAPSAGNFCRAGFTIQGLGKNPGGGSFSHAPGTGKQISMGDSPLDD